MIGLATKHCHACENGLKGICTKKNTNYKFDVSFVKETDGPNFILKKVRALYVTNLTST